MSDIEKATAETLAIAKGESPAARIYHNGHFYVPQAEVEQHLGQIEKLSEELELTKREAERAQDAHGVRFLNYLEETARLSDEITRLRAALREARALALEEAARLADKAADELLVDDGGTVCANLAADIRALKEKTNGD